MLRQQPARDAGAGQLRQVPGRAAAGWEASGTSPGGMRGLVSCGKFTGVPLRKVLSDAGVRSDAREIVFFGADHREEEVDFRGTKYKVDQQFGRSLTREEATAPGQLA